MSQLAGPSQRTEANVIRARRGWKSSGTYHEQFGSCVLGNVLCVEDALQLFRAVADNSANGEQKKLTNLH